MKKKLLLGLLSLLSLNAFADNNLLEKEFAGGYYTPSKLMGPDILDSLPGFSGIEYSDN